VDHNAPTKARRPTCATITHALWIAREPSGLIGLAAAKRVAVVKQGDIASPWPQGHSVAENVYWTLPQNKKKSAAQRIALWIVFGPPGRTGTLAVQPLEVLESSIGNGMSCAQTDTMVCHVKGPATKFDLVKRQRRFLD
jgi:hypothetical protein